MIRRLHVLTLAAGIGVIAVLGFARKEERLQERRPKKHAEREALAPEAAGTPAPPKAAGGSIEAMLAAAASPDRSPDVLSGPFKVEGSEDGAAVPAELGLSASQRAIVDALLADREARLAQIRLEVERRPPKGADVDRTCADAERAQETCMAAIRSILLPEQQAVFDALRKSGRWGGYTLLIPHAR